MKNKMTQSVVAPN